MGLKFRVNTKPEKAIISAAAALMLSIVFDGKKKKMRGSKKYRSFPKRIVKNYKLVDGLLKKTAAKELYSNNEHFKDPKLDAMTIENGEFIDI